MSTATADGSDDDFRTRGQQSPLASQRAKQSNDHSEANETGRISGYFPLGYKEGFSQWVSADL
jgi:cardiolipin-specific phospholipase